MDLDASRWLSYESILSAYPANRPSTGTIDQDLACLIYTSGSSGEPKGVMCSHHNMVFAASSVTEYLENTSDDVIICALPLSFDYGLYQLLMAFQCGARLVLERSFAYPARFLQQIEAAVGNGGRGSWISKLFHFP